jgi:hypothetical protein
MPLQPATKEFVKFLQQNPSVREKIRAQVDHTLLYAGHFFTASWKEIASLRTQSPAVAALETLPDVLNTIPAPSGKGNMLGYVEALCNSVPNKDFFVIWRALSGIFASNARGRVYFCLGKDVKQQTKVFAATEIWVLGRNKQIDPLTMEVVGYLQDCIKKGKVDLNFGFLPE